MTVWTHIGNVPKFSVTPTPTVQKHKSAMGPLKAIDFVNTTLVEMAFDMQCDEWTRDNVMMGLLGQIATDTAGEMIKIGVAPVRRQLKFVGANAIGPRFELVCPSVFINAKDAIDFISQNDESSPMPLSGDILFDITLNAFGTIRYGDGYSPFTSPNVENYYVGTGSIYTAPIE